LRRGGHTEGDRLIEGLLSDLQPLVEPSLAALLALVVLLVLTGRLVPLSTIRRELEAERQRAADIKAAHDAMKEVASKQAEQLQLIVPYAQVADQVLTELRRRSEQREPPS
jgi:hypothetical protein